MKKKPFLLHSVASKSTLCEKEILKADFLKL